MKATILLTTSCNLTCDYCYIQKHSASMSEEILLKAIDFVFNAAPPDETVDFGLFGGEPLLEWKLAQQAVAVIEQLSKIHQRTARVSLVTNGTLLDVDILEYMRDHNLVLQVSCDGIPHVQDLHRTFSDSKPTSAVVENNILQAIQILPVVLVNVVYSPDTYFYLPESIEYLASLGVRQIVLNPDYSATWLPEHLSGLEQTYACIAELYLKQYRQQRPLFISLIDEKLAVILRGGYGPSDRCRMGYREYAISPSGYIFPCERLVGNGLQNQHCIGHLDKLDNLTRTHCKSEGNASQNSVCQQCSVAGFCMNWCGCSNFHATGNYHLPSYFICASERLAINTALGILSDEDNDQKLAYINHYAGFPMLNSSLNQEKGGTFMH